jgi:tellurite resistance protein TerB
MLPGLKKKLLGGLNRFNGNTDFLEAVCASCALVANADGDISDEEVSATTDAVSTNPTLAGAFKPRVIEKAISTALDRTKSRPGRLALFKELDDVKDDDGEIVYLAALDVADADGNIDKDERAVLSKIAGHLGVNESALVDV